LVKCETDAGKFYFKASLSMSLEWAICCTCTLATAFAAKPASARTYNRPLQELAMGILKLRRPLQDLATVILKPKRPLQDLAMGILKLKRPLQDLAMVILKPKQPLQELADHVFSNVPDPMLWLVDWLQAAR
jgi:hypothetical protein